MGGGDVRPQEDNVETVRRCKVHRTKKDVGGHYRRLIPHCSVIAAVLTFLWESKCSPYPYFQHITGQHAFGCG